MPTLTFWIDVDNTLLANDDVKQRQDDFLQSELGPELTKRYWDAYEQVRKEKGVVDIPFTLRRFREQIPHSELDDYTYRHAHSMFDNFPFYNFLYPEALETLQALNRIGTTVIVSDGDLNYQAEKILNSAVAEAVGGRVLLYIHKQHHLEEIMQRYPADHYAMIDDKPQILADMKKLLGDKLTTVFVKQGKYANAGFPEGFIPDVSVEHLKDLQQLPASQFYNSTTAS
ncbi:MAG TPA: HAD family hydrolase [Dictyobacter sp.]|jgi:FMN phosphatase YigB (HAD superfamily)|nr:HAD family hydrolase [Dictyobacter sp.]